MRMEGPPGPIEVCLLTVPPALGSVPAWSCPPTPAARPSLAPPSPGFPHCHPAEALLGTAGMVESRMLPAAPARVSSEHRPSVPFLPPCAPLSLRPFYKSDEMASEQLPKACACRQVNNEGQIEEGETPVLSAFKNACGSWPCFKGILAFHRP